MRLDAGILGNLVPDLDVLGKTVAMCLHPMNVQSVCRINVGCGSSPTSGWLNFDGSPSVRLANRPLLTKLLDSLRLLRDENKRFIAFCRGSDIHWANAARNLPVPTGSVSVLYSSHMLEHLDKREATDFLTEARRVLKHEGIIRLAVPDLRRIISDYETDGDADRLVSRTQLAHIRPRTLLQKLRWLFVADRSHHRWMYDANSLMLFLTEAGFSHVVVQTAGATMIPNPGDLNLHEREDESLYVEALRLAID
jgi:SAM-dependent methyltransferase